MGPWGTVVVDERIFAVVDIQLRGGEIVVYGRAEGPVRGWAGGVTVMRLIGSDGLTVGELRNVVPAWEDMGPGHTVTVVFPIHLESIVSQAGDLG